MSRSTDSFKRHSPKFRQQPKVLIICEDSVSGKQYLEDAAFHFRADAKVEIAHYGITHPSGIVEEAVSKRKKFDKIFCAIDRDEHDCFDKALLLAKAYDNIHIIASYPCFEFWLILHFGYVRKPFHRTGNRSPGDNVNKHLRSIKGMEQYNKSAKYNAFKLLLGEKFETARKFSPKALKDAEQIGEKNPSTEIHLLIDELEALGEIQKI